MLPKKMFFPIGGGDELNERIHGALLVSKFFNTHLEVLISHVNMNDAIPQGVGLSNDVMKRLDAIHTENLDRELNMHGSMFTSCCKELDIEVSDNPVKDKSTVCSIDYHLGV